MENPYCSCRLTTTAWWWVQGKDLGARAVFDRLDEVSAARAANMDCPPSYWP